MIAFGNTGQVMSYWELTSSVFFTSSHLASLATHRTLPIKWPSKTQQESLSVEKIFKYMLSVCLLRYMTPLLH